MVGFRLGIYSKISTAFLEWLIKYNLRELN